MEKTDRRASIIGLIVLLIANTSAAGADWCTSALVNISASFSDVPYSLITLVNNIPNLCAVIFTLVAGALVNRKVTLKNMILIGTGLHCVGGIMPAFTGSSFALLMLGRRPAFLLVLLKAGFAFLVRGATAGFLSLCGGGLSFFTFCVLLALPFPVTGYIFSVCGALAHNTGQLLGAAVLLSDRMALGYAPILLVCATVVGSATWAVSHALFPALQKVLPGRGRGESKIKF